MKSKYKDIINVMAVVVLVLGIIGTIMIAYTYGVDVSVSSYSYRTYTERNWTTTIVYFIAGSFVTAVEYIVMQGIGECLEFHEKIGQKLDELHFKGDNVTNDCNLPPL